MVSLTAAQSSPSTPGPAAATLRNGALQASGASSAAVRDGRRPRPARRPPRQNLGPHLAQIPTEEHRKAAPEHPSPSSSFPRRSEPGKKSHRPLPAAPTKKPRRTAARRDDVTTRHAFLRTAARWGGARRGGSLCGFLAAAFGFALGSGSAVMRNKAICL